ncbi:MAG: glutamine synthetase III [Bacteroidia bacterium]|nr:glutamine synthetase III [Bacteroidia bacterium]
MNVRQEALRSILSRALSPKGDKAVKTKEIFGESVFHRTAMKSYLSDQAYKTLSDAMEKGRVLDSGVAGAVAGGIKAWAIDKGATHYTHWFQPLTGRTAEKHESFLAFLEGEPIEKFSGTELSQQEPDASSFPSGGLRTTFEARGYTAWDSSSPVFLLDTSFGTTLCIPTIFVSYTGQSLDYKMPLLKSISKINQAATDLCQFFDVKVSKVTPTLGLEQEYFLVDKNYYLLRPDLYQTGRTLFGAKPARGQQMSDHYFGAIPERIYAFMNELELEAHRMGIPLKTRHNEVAPGQFECAPVFESVNIAIDHGLMIMDLLDRIANKHGLVALLHEKPFAGLNGSGKHNNWSLMTDSGKNLLSPGSKPGENLMFLSFFVCVIKAVWEHSGLLKAAIVSAGNDLRLGSHEAPPAIISVFLGHQLDKVLKDIENPPRKKRNEDVDPLMHLGIASIPELLLDNTDRNRTSPFAFTGNKFEIRAVGASANSSLAMTVLNTIVAEQLIEFRSRVKSKINRGRPQDLAVLDMLKEFITESKNIRFEGDSYSKEWVELATKRSLATSSRTPDALASLIQYPSIKLFKKMGVMSEAELKSRHDVLTEKYLQQGLMEAQVMKELIMTNVLPASSEYQSALSDLALKKNELGINNNGELSLLRKLTKIGEELLFGLEEIDKSLDELLGINDKVEQARKFSNILPNQLVFCREKIDQLEVLLPDQSWPFPKYRELLLIR